jgi:hypothetical protein
MPFANVAGGGRAHDVTTNLFTGRLQAKMKPAHCHVLLEVPLEVSLKDTEAVRANISDRVK